MKFDQIDSTELLVSNPAFVRLVNLIYRFLKENLKSFPESRIKAFTTVLANYELKNFQDSSEESVIFRVNEYCDRINDDAEYLSTIEDEFELWLNLLIVATSSRNADQSLVTDQPELSEEQYNNFIEVIYNSGIFSIERIIWKLKEPSLAKLIIGELGDLIYTQKNFCLASFISNIGSLQKGLLPIVKILTVALKAKNSVHDQEKNKAMLVNEHRELIVKHCRKLFGKCFQPAQTIRNAKDIFIRTFRAFEQRLRTKINLRRSVKKAKAQTKSAEKRHQLYSMLHSHSPTENVKIPAFLASNTELKREAKRLASLGMTIAESCDKAVVCAPDQNKFKSLVTRVAKGQGARTAVQ